AWPYPNPLLRGPARGREKDTLNIPWRILLFDRYASGDLRREFDVDDWMNIRGKQRLAICALRADHRPTAVRFIQRPDKYPQIIWFFSTLKRESGRQLPRNRLGLDCQCSAK